MLGDTGGRLLDILSSPYATALMWILPVMFEMAVVWLLVHLYRRRKALRNPVPAPSLPGQPVSAPAPETRPPLLVRSRRG